ncbi:MAG: prenyltransferase/squalene oxidase repeat-containing protein [Promethearchaeota archaeon]
MKKEYRYFLIFTTFLLCFISITPLGMAKTRYSYLIDFIYSQQTPSERFGNSYEETAQALEILHYYNAFSIGGIFGTEKQVDIKTLGNYLENQLSDGIDNSMNIYDIYFILKSLNLLNHKTSDTLLEKVHEYLNKTSLNEGGFSINIDTKKPNLIATFYGMLAFNILGKDLPNKTLHLNWILSCNNSDGGYGGNRTLPSTLLTTYQAISSIIQLGTVNQVVNKTATINFLNSLYINDPNDFERNGGYLPEIHAWFPLLSSTYFCVSSLDLLNLTYLHESTTIKWVLSRQNSLDGGFFDKTEEDVQGSSSITSSYYAFKILQLFNSLDLLDEDVFTVEFNYVLLGIVLGIIVVAIVISIYVWRKRKL